MILRLVSSSSECTIYDSFTLQLYSSNSILVSPAELRKFPFGVLAAQPEEVAADLVPKILAQKDNGGSVEFLTTDRILTKFFERFILQKKSEYIDDDGNVIKVPGEQYDETGARALY
jgi:chlorophyll(ide) b reductase